MYENYKFMSVEWEEKKGEEKKGEEMQGGQLEELERKNVAEKKKKEEEKEAAREEDKKRKEKGALRAVGKELASFAMEGKKRGREEEEELVEVKKKHRVDDTYQKTKKSLKDMGL